ncbi:uncharacterized protein F4822DRAFT_430737 [Hypoxylon trugodes]|uniref:uncharacterized protein n=1 Tax=Hypoxylon trugodes TaxID=326681 RepID=UPI00218EF438|nr:uncharacterized protein F4822DRAFT_430737 [Hypoxylon trugodes]KAI1387987.1 hypothetical protein F4822DRAFT_430737 [Hypoxylon trugodes]
MSGATPKSTEQPAKPLASYSLIRKVPFDPPHQQFLYISGTTARLSDGQIPPYGYQLDDSVAQDVAAATQTETIFSKIASAIDNSSGGAAGLESLVEMTIFVTNLEKHYGAVNNVYNRVIGKLFHEKGLPLPARTCVQVSGMPPDARTLVEIKGIAVISYT